ncbi:MAG: ABC transporter substrate-binding protein [Deltaproteobacteria bacterium]|nr:ABC transporter substrate-binding protein [Deltaproteobacteria bacterium]
MKTGKGVFLLVCVFSLVFLLTILNPPQSIAAAVKARFEVSKMGDMSDFDPSNPVIPTGDTIKIAVVGSFSGPAAAAGEGFFLDVQWAAHDYNKRGGIMVDGKKKLIQVFKADTAGKPAQAKQVCEQMVLQNGVKFLIGSDGSHIVKVMNQVADKYKVIAMNFVSMSDDLQDATNFSRYAFMPWWQTSQSGKAFAYFYGQIRKKEKKFYILCQDYLFGHDLAEGFKNGLKEYYPGAQIVGEDFHKLFMTDFAPYISKIKASGAEVIFTGDWNPDALNLLKQARQMGVHIPIAQIFIVDPVALSSVGIEGSKGLVLGTPVYDGNPVFKTPEMIKYYNIWNNLYKTKFKPPYNSRAYEWGWDPLAMETYWLLSVIERAGSVDPEKIIKVWEGDSYQYVNGHVATMRACDHNTIQDLYITEYVPPDQQKVAFNIPPYHWGQGDYSFTGPAYKIPSEKVIPWMDPKLERCKGKNPASAN